MPASGNQEEGQHGTREDQDPARELDRPENAMRAGVEPGVSSRSEGLSGSNPNYLDKLKWKFGNNRVVAWIIVIALALTAVGAPSIYSLVDGYFARVDPDAFKVSVRLTPLEKQLFGELNLKHASRACPGYEVLKQLGGFEIETGIARPNYKMAFGIHRKHNCTFKARIFPEYRCRQFFLLNEDADLVIPESGEMTIELEIGEIRNFFTKNQSRFQQMESLNQSSTIHEISPDIRPTDTRFLRTIGATVDMSGLDSDFALFKQVEAMISHTHSAVSNVALEDALSKRIARERVATLLTPGGTVNTYPQGLAKYTMRSLIPDVTMPRVEQHYGYPTKGDTQLARKDENVMHSILEEVISAKVNKIPVGESLNEKLDGLYLDVYQELLQRRDE